MRILKDVTRGPAGGNYITLLLIASVIMVIAAFTLPRLFNGRRVVASGCLAGLKQLDGATRAWAFEHGKGTNAVPTDADLFGPTLYLKAKPQCPDGGTYILGSSGRVPRCSIAAHNKFL